MCIRDSREALQPPSLQHPTDRAHKTSYFLSSYQTPLFFKLRQHFSPDLSIADTAIETLSSQFFQCTTSDGKKHEKTEEILVKDLLRPVSLRLYVWNQQAIIPIFSPVYYIDCLLYTSTRGKARIPSRNAA